MDDGNQPEAAFRAIALIGRSWLPALTHGHVPRKLEAGLRAVSDCIDREQHADNGSTLLLDASFAALNLTSNARKVYICSPFSPIATFQNGADSA